ncbi:MAG: dihydrodipicolinate synthase family protein [Limisphaerales bacterium]
MCPTHPLHGLVAATYTPLHADRTLNLAMVEKIGAHLLRDGITTVFINGTTGECPSLSTDERRAIAQRWIEVARGTELKVSVHVGSNCLADARSLAAHAEQLGAISISAFAPSYFKPRDVGELIAWSAEIAAAAPNTPFYFYDIPVFTHVALSMPEFLERAPGSIPNLVGLKFSNPDLAAYQLCVAADGGRFDVAFGCDEWILAALVLGGRGGVGSTYNFAAPLYHRLLKHLAAGDLAEARKEQLKSAQLVRLLSRHGFMGAAKATMKMLGIDVGPARLPHATLDPAQTRQLQADLDALGFFQGIR